MHIRLHRILLFLPGVTSVDPELCSAMQPPRTAAGDPGCVCVCVVCGGRGGGGATAKRETTKFCKEGLVVEMRKCCKAEPSDRRRS